MDRVGKAVAEDLAALTRTARDWSAWDEAYDFVATGAPTFIARNLADKMFADIDVNAIVFVDGARRRCRWQHSPRHN